MSLERGGRITDALERISHSLQETQRIERKLEVDTASGKKVVYILTGFPFFFLGLSYFMNPDGTATVFQSLLGPVDSAGGHWPVLLQFPLEPEDSRDRSLTQHRTHHGTPAQQPDVSIERLPAGVAPAGRWPSGMALWQLFAVLSYPRDRLGDAHPFERQRREELRAGNSIYRWFEPVIEEIGGVLPQASAHVARRSAHNLVVSREKLPWRPEEFLATKWLEAIVSGVVLFGILWLAGWYKSAVVLGADGHGGLRRADAQDDPRPRQAAARRGSAIGCRSPST